MLDDLVPGDPRGEDLEQIRQAAVGATALTRQLLAFSRQQVIEPRLLTLEQVVTGAGKLLTRLIGEDVELVIRLTDQPATVRIDPGQLEQVIMNLAVNARDAMPTGGKLTIETHALELDETYAHGPLPVTPGRFAMLAVSDTGVGMDEATRARIFEPFFTTKELGRGTGLGLSTVEGIVKQSGGFIQVDSEPGVGTSFKIYLPSVDEPAGELPIVASSGRRTGTETVLLVEDSPAVSGAARNILNRCGYVVLEAPNAEAALALAATRQGPIHLLLTDVVMPGMSGRELGDRFTAIRPETKVLFMSGYTNDAVLRRGVLASGIAFLQKPFSPDALATKVRGVLDSGAPPTNGKHVTRA
jgi:two-component system, cell cycle sensor histidine kinase and response regulator CckA